MANVVTIEAETRARAGKGAARATRRAGQGARSDLWWETGTRFDRAGSARGAAGTASRRLAVPALRTEDRRRAGACAHPRRAVPSRLRTTRSMSTSSASSPGSVIKVRGAGAFRERRHQPRPEAGRGVERGAACGGGLL